MDDEKPKKRWWRKKRWGAALALALAVWYPVSAGPFYYVVGRGLIPGPMRRWVWLNDLYDPVRAILLAPPVDRTPLFTWWAAMVERCFRAGIDEAAAD